MATPGSTTRSTTRSQNSQQVSYRSHTSRQDTSVTVSSIQDVSSDQEISFKTVDRAPSTTSGSVDDLTSTRRSRHSSTRGADSIHSASMRSLSTSAIYRLDSLETDVNIMRSDLQGVKASMEGVNLQLAILVSAAQKDATDNTPKIEENPTKATTKSTQPPHGTLAINNTAHNKRTPTPGDLRKAAATTGFVDFHLKKEEMSHVKSDGKNPFICDIFTEKLIGKPYMFIAREGVRTLKEKMEVRSSMKSGEYINALIALLQSPAAYESENHAHMNKHLHEVSTDSLSRPWKNVLAWSQHVFDEVEKKNVQWHEYQLIQNARFRLCFAATDTQFAPQVFSQHNSYAAGGKMLVSCPDFNQAKGCKHKGDHDITGVKFLHVCAFCMAKGKQLPHNIIACNNKMFESTHTHQPSNPQGNRGVVNANVYSQNQPQVPKN